jgi:ribosome-associated protein
MTRFLYDITTEGQEEEFGPSKTQVKGEMHDLLDLGLALLELPHERFAKLPMSELLRSAFDELQRITNFGARKRQAQYIGKLLRDVDTTPFENTLAIWRKGKEEAAKGFPDLAKWRDRLLSEDVAFTDWCTAHPGVDTRKLRTLIRNARQEESAAAEEAAHSGKSVPKGRYYRELFQALRANADAAADRET